MTRVNFSFSGQALPPRRRPRVAVRSRLTGRMDSDVPFMDKKSCAIHQVSFYVVKDAVQSHGCPVCDRDEVIDELRGQIQEMQTDLQMAMQSTQRLSVQVSELDAMRKSLELCNVDDMTFLKSVLYRWREDETALQLFSSQDAEDQWQFLVRIKRSLGEQHLCRTIGSIALAAAYEQAVKVSGINNAMRMLLRAISQHLANVDAE